LVIAIVQLSVVSLRGRRITGGGRDGAMTAGR
jgi:hypothetical protein